MPSSNERSNGTSMTMPWAGLGQLMIGVNHGNVPHGATVAVDFGNVASTARADGRQYHIGLAGALRPGNNTVPSSSNARRHVGFTV